MMEARIECLVSEYPLPDLGLHLTKGQVEWVSQTKAQRSQELKLAQRAGAVELRWEERCVVSKDKIPPYMRRRGKGTAPIVKPRRVQPAQPAQPAPVTMVDMAEVARVAREAATEAAQAVRQDVVAEVRKALDERGEGTGLTREDVTAALQDVLGGLQLGVAHAPAPQAAGVVEEDEPMFIPSKIGDDNSKAEITVEGTEAASSSSFDAASAALKAAAPPKKRRRKKKPPKKPPAAE